MADDDIVMDMARYIWRKRLTIAEFYEALGVDLEDMRAYHVDDVVTRLSGIFDGWNNPPSFENEEGESKPI